MGSKWVTHLPNKEQPLVLPGSAKNAQGVLLFFSLSLNLETHIARGFSAWLYVSWSGEDGPLASKYGADRGLVFGCVSWSGMAGLGSKYGG